MLVGMVRILALLMVVVGQVQLAATLLEIII
jgi:hypothetical protein